MSLLVTREEYINSYQNPKTQKQVEWAFVAWDKFLEDKQVSESDLFLEIRTEETKLRRYRILNQVVQFWSKDKHRSTILNYLNFVKGWFRYNEIELDNYKIKQYVKVPKAVRERVRGIDRNMIKQLIDLCEPFYRGLWFVLAYTGMRIGECLEMKWSWIDFTKSPLMITIGGESTKTSQERITFAGGEAEEWLRKRHADQVKSEKDLDGKVFGDLTYFAAWQYFDRRRKKLGFVERGANGWYHYRPHKYRGYAENKLGRGSGGSEFAHSILGHTKGLLQYNQSGATDEDARNDYVSAFEHLAISDEARYKDEAERYKEKAESIDDLKRKLVESEMRIKRLEDMRQKQ